MINVSILKVDFFNLEYLKGHLFIYTFFFYLLIIAAWRGIVISQYKPMNEHVEPVLNIFVFS